MILHDDPLGQLRPAVGRCLGATFVTHVLDERFLEQVLAALLPIEADPEADPRFFIDEGRRRLRQTPVVVVADARQYVGGHRLPYEVVLSPWNTRVHARLALLLFEDHARLFVGSGNLTRSGFGNNAELFTSSRLDYEKDGATFRAVTELATACGAAGDAWERFTTQLGVLVGEVAGDTALLFGDDVIEQFLAGIPRSATIESLAVSAAASAEDDPGDVAPLLDALGTWLKKRKAKRAPIDVVLPWPNTGGAREPAEPAELDEAAGKLAVYRDGERLVWCRIDAVSPDEVTLVAGKRRIAAPRASLVTPPGGEARFWIYAEAIGAGPVAALESLAGDFDVTWWLWPDSLPGRRRRPLHGNWLLVQTKEGRTRRSHLLAGAFQPAAPKGQRIMTAGLHWRPQKPLPLAELAPDLVRPPDDGFFFQEAELPPARQVPPPPATGCSYDARARTLRLAWRAGVRGAKAIYSHPGGDVTLAEGSPGLETLVRDFEVDRLSADVTIQQGEHVWLLPISIANLAYLPADEGARPATLRAWVAHHLGGRGAREENDADGNAPEALTTPPRDVFAALDAVRAQLEGAGASLGEVDVALSGPFGCRALAQLLESDQGLLRAEAWFYGQELVRMLRSVRSDDSGAERLRRRALAQVIEELARAFDAGAPKEEAVAAAQRFYRSVS
jgi:hypothetical protein